MATSKAKEYVLPPHAAESKRLNRQHEGFVSSAGYLLHPRIVDSLATREDVRIADVATGTAAWLLDLETEVASSSSSWSIIGLDLSADQFPSTDSTQCRFDTLDIRQAIPERYQNYFDVVHIRMLLGGLTTPDCERVKQAGFTGAEIYSPSSDRVPEMRAQISLAMMEDVASAYKYLAKTDMDCPVRVEEVEEIAEKSRAELDGGKSYWRWDMYILTAQKAAV